MGENVSLERCARICYTHEAVTSLWKVRLSVLRELQSASPQRACPFRPQSLRVLPSR